MHKNIFWQAFLAILFCANIGYSGMALYHYYSYQRLTNQTFVISSMNWNVIQHAEDDFTLEAKYKFPIHEKTYEGTTAWPKEHYLNQWAAEERTKHTPSGKWKVWYDQSNPNHSSLEKQFPYKESISAAILWALFLYFLWLGYYVTKYKT